MKITPRKNGFGNITEQELKHIQSNLLNLLLEFDSICKEHNITYYLDGGSVLGAMRHGGFIPWDDDVDILIKSSEFDKLMTVIDKELALRPDRLFSYLGREYNHHKPFARYVNTVNPHIVRSAITEANYPPGIFLDIFIIDPVPSSKLDNHRKTLEQSEDWFHKLLDGSTSMPYWKYMSINIIEKFTGQRPIYTHFINKLSAYTDEEADYYIPRNGFNYAVYDADVFQEPTYVDFEGHRLPAPTMPEKFVRTHYSIDWFLLPPPEKRLSHHLTLTSDRFSVKDFMSYFDWSSSIPTIHKVQEKRHKYQILRKKPVIKTRVYIAELRSIIDSMEVKNYLDTIKPAALKKLVQNKRYQQIIDLLQPYLDKQLNGEYRQFGIQIAIPSDYLLILLNALVEVGRFYDAERLLSVYDTDDSTLDTVRNTIELALQTELEEQDNPSRKKPILTGVPAVVRDEDLPPQDTSILDTQLHLLDEIDQVCKDNGIDYTLTGNALIDAIRYGKVSKTYTDITIAMTPRNFRAFINLFQKSLPKDRVIDSILSNPYYPDRSARYINTKTTSYQITAPWYQHPGIHVSIRLLKEPLGTKRNTKEKRIRKLNNLAYLLPKPFKWIMTPVTKQHRKNLLESIDSEPSYIKTAIITKPRRAVVMLESSEMEEYDTILLNNKKYQVMKSLPEKLRTQKPWLYAIELKDVRKDVNRVRSVHVPYSNFLQQIPDKITTRYYLPKFHENILLKKIRRVEKSKYSHKKILFNIAYKFYVFKLNNKYAPMTDQLLALVTKKDFDQVECLLDEYIENFNYFFQYNKVLVFDPTVFAVYLELLKHQGKAEFAYYIASHVQSKDYKVSTHNLAGKTKDVDDNSEDEEEDI